MRILILTQVYPPERHPTAIMVDELARFLAEQGHQVGVATGLPNHPSPAEFQDYPATVYKRHDDGGVHVLRTWHPRPSSRSVPIRALGMALQAGSATIGSVGFSKPDVLVCFGLPLLGPLLSAIRTTFSSAKLVTVVYDIYPDVAINSEALRSQTLIRVARAVEQASYRVSDRIVVLSHGFRSRLVVRGVPAAKISVIPVWLRDNEIQPTPRMNPWRESLGIAESQFVVLYAGTLGVASGASVIVDAARRLNGSEHVLFLVVGNGQEKARMQELAAQYKLENLRFLPFQPRAQLANVQATADLALVTLGKGMGHSSVPSKVISYLAAGRPILASVDRSSDTAECVTRGGGHIVGPGDPAAIAAGVERYMRDPALRGRASSMARRLFDEEYSASRVLPRFLSAIALTIEGRAEPEADRNEEGACHHDRPPDR